LGTTEGSLREVYKEYTWRKASEFLAPETSVIFVDGANPADIQQGSLGNCWLMCSLGAISEQQHLVDNIFENVELFNDGQSLLRLKLCVGGVWETVALDDFFPCFPLSGPVFSRSSNNREIWVLLVEKAFAKICGSYESLVGGYAFEGMMDLTGCPSEMFLLKDKVIGERLRSGEIFKDLVEWLKKKWLVCCSTVETKREKSAEELKREKNKRNKRQHHEQYNIDKKNGLVKNHAYTLLNAVSLSNGSQLVKVRNLWGGFEWNGDWSDFSNLWTSAVKFEIAQKIQQPVEDIVKDGST